MSLHHNGQMSGPSTIDMNDSGSAAEKALLPVVLAISLRLEAVTQKWQANYNDGNGWAQLSDQTGYVPPIRVRRINICDESSDARQIEFNLAGNGEQMAKGTKANPNRDYQEAIIEIFRTNQMHDLHITKIYLADGLQRTSGNNATYIVLHG